MNIVAEKEEIVKRIYGEQDVSVIHAVKDLLDAWNLQPFSDEALERELDLAIKEADNGELIPYEEILADFRKKYTERAIL